MWYFALSCLQEVAMISFAFRAAPVLWTKIRSLMNNREFSPPFRHIVAALLILLSVLQPLRGQDHLRQILIQERERQSQMYNIHAPALGSSDSLFTVLGRWAWGPCEAVDARGHYVYLGNGPTFHVLDVSDPSHPLIIGEWVTSGYVYDIRLKNSLAFVATANGLLILDVSDPRNPEELSSINVGHQVSRVALADSFVFVSGFPGPVTLVEVTNPRAPRVRSMVPGFHGEWPDCMDARGRFLYFGNFEVSNLGIVDAQDPDSIRWVESARLDAFAHTGFVSDTLLLLGMTAYDQKNYIGVYSIARPDTAVELGRVEVPEVVTSITADSANAYASFFETGISIMVDIRDPRNPVIRQQFIPDWLQLRGRGRLARTGNLLLEPFAGAGLRIFDVSASDSMTLVSFVPTGGFPERIDWVGNRAYIACGFAGLWILDATDPARLRPIQNIYTGGYACDVEVKDTLVLLANYAQHFPSDGSSGLWVIGLRETDAPRILSHYVGISRIPPAALYQNTISCLGDLVVMTQMGDAAYDSTLEVIDLARPSAPERKAIIKIGLNPYGITSSSNYAYAGYFDAGMQIIDLSEPAVPRVLGSVSNPCKGIVLADTLAYLMAGYLNAVSVAALASPSVLDTAFLTGGVLGMSGATVPNYLYWSGGRLVALMCPIRTTSNL